MVQVLHGACGVPERCLRYALTVLLLRRGYKMPALWLTYACGIAYRMLVLCLKYACGIAYRMSALCLHNGLTMLTPCFGVGLGRRNGRNGGCAAFAPTLPLYYSTTLLYCPTLLLYCPTPLRLYGYAGWLVVLVALGFVFDVVEVLGVLVSGQIYACLVDAPCAEAFGGKG